MPAIAAAPAFYAALATGAATTGAAVISAKAQSGATRRSIAANDRAATRAETAAREEDALNRADAERRDAEERRRWEVEQANLARTQAQTDERLAYEDAIRYGKMVNLARLTGQPIPPKPPSRAGGSIADLASDSPRPASAPIMSRPSTANASIAPPGSIADITGGNGGFANPTNTTYVGPQRMPISQLVGRRRVI